MNKKLDVWWEDRRVGSLVQDREGKISFTYSPEWIDGETSSAISASLPKRAQRYSQRECRPFFGGLLPEGGQRDAAAGALGVSRANDFALLDRLGGEVAGALCLLPEGETPPTAAAPHSTHALDEIGILRVLDALPARPLMAGEEGLRLSLAGAQSKVPVIVSHGSIALPTDGQPSTHILKPPIARFPDTTENEAFVMRLAAAVGLEVASVEPRVVKDRSFLLVERYDRVREPSGAVRRLHQEDFCQALGVLSDRKYEAEGGPAIRDCFALVRRVSSRPAVDVLRLLDATIFNVLVGNADAHAKNFSILYGEGAARLAPLYDLLSTVAYPELSNRFAMKIGRRGTLAEMNATAWATFATDAELGLPLVRRRIGELSAAAVEELPRVANGLAHSGLSNGAFERLQASMQARSDRCSDSIRDRA